MKEKTLDLDDDDHHHYESLTLLTSWPSVSATTLALPVETVPVVVAVRNLGNKGRWGLAETFKICGIPKVLRFVVFRKWKCLTCCKKEIDTTSVFAVVWKVIIEVFKLAMLFRKDCKKKVKVNRSPIQNYLWLLPRIHCVLSSTLPPSILGSNDKHLPRIRRWTNRAQDRYLQEEVDGDGYPDDGDDGLGWWYQSWLAQFHPA